jgi:uncharacterized membrane protein YgcG
LAQQHKRRQNADKETEKRTVPTSKGVWVRFIILGLVWLWLVGLVITSAKSLNFFSIFTIVASGIVVFVPMYKKYLRK